MGYNLLRHALLGLYNHFNTHEAEYRNTIFNHCSDVLPYQYVHYAYVRACMRALVRLNISILVKKNIMIQISITIVMYCHIDMHICVRARAESLNIFPVNF